MLTIAILGGTGPQGKGLGYRFAAAGHSVILGSRSEERAKSVAAELRALASAGTTISGADNATAAARAELALIAVPFEGYRELIAGVATSLAEKIVVSCVNPLGFDKRGPFGLDVPEGSAAEIAAAILPSARVVSAFHHVSAANLINPAPPFGEDVLVCGDDKQATAVVCELAATVVGKDGVDAGPLRMSRYLENFTAVLISINKRYRAHSGVAISGLPVTHR